MSSTTDSNSSETKLIISNEKNPQQSNTTAKNENTLHINKPNAEKRKTHSTSNSTRSESNQHSENHHQLNNVNNRENPNSNSTASSLPSESDLKVQVDPKYHWTDQTNNTNREMSLPDSNKQSFSDHKSCTHLQPSQSNVFSDMQGAFNVSSPDSIHLVEHSSKHEAFKQQFEAFNNFFAINYLALLEEKYQFIRVFVIVCLIGVVSFGYTFYEWYPSDSTAVNRLSASIFSLCLLWCLLTIASRLFYERIFGVDIWLNGVNNTLGIYYYRFDPTQLKLVDVPANESTKRPTKTYPRSASKPHSTLTSQHVFDQFENEMREQEDRTRKQKQSQSKRASASTASQTTTTVISAAVTNINHTGSELRLRSNASLVDLDSG